MAKKEMNNAQAELSTYKAGEDERIDAVRRAYLDSINFKEKLAKRFSRTLNHVAGGVIQQLKKGSHLPMNLSLHFVDQQQLLEVLPKDLLSKFK